MSRTKIDFSKYEYPWDCYELYMHEKKRPQSFDDFCGQDEIKTQLKIIAHTSKIEEKVFPHLLLTGGAGVGKTTLSEILAKELGVEFYTTTAATINNLVELKDIISARKPNSIIFLDEIHQLNRDIQEGLFYAMEDFKISYFSPKFEQPVTLELWPFCLIGATTDPQKLLKPLRDRFVMNIHMRSYNIDELKLIAHDMAQKQEMYLMDESALKIALACRNTPRIIARLITTLKKYVNYSNVNDLVSPDKVDQCFEIFQIHKLGLTPLDLKYLEILHEFYGEKGAGLKTMATSLGENKIVLEEVIEPFLIQEKYIILTPKGRRITQKGINILTHGDLNG